MGHQMDLFSGTRTKKQVSFKDALISGTLAGMVNEAVRGETISNPETLYNILSPLMAQHPTVEKFYCIYLDTKNKIISIDPVFSGSLSSCSVYPREIIKECIEKGAASLIVAHNHPSGDLTPSFEDKQITRRLLVACSVMGISFHEHVICGGGDYFSMANDGIISKQLTEIKAIL
jgi:DNA repair protein RadC